MTRFTNLEKVIVQFLNRDGVPTILELKQFPEKAYSDITVTDDGLNADFYVVAQDIDNGAGYALHSGEDYKVLILPSHMVEADAIVAPMGAPESNPELSPVARWTLGVVGLAILTPFIAILWSWSIGVIQR
jgi:predicted nuclease of predicted toxin-antitoxin system